MIRFHSCFNHSLKSNYKRFFSCAKRKIIKTLVSNEYDGLKINKPQSKPNFMHQILIPRKKRKKEYTCNHRAKGFQCKYQIHIQIIQL